MTRLTTLVVNLAGLVDAAAMLRRAQQRTHQEMAGSAAATRLGDLASQLSQPGSGLSRGVERHLSPLHNAMSEAVLKEKPTRRQGADRSERRTSQRIHQAPPSAGHPP